MHFRDFLPLSANHKDILSQIESDILEKDLDRIKTLLKRQQAGVVKKQFNLSQQLGCDRTYFQFSPAAENDDISAFLASVNQQLEQAAFEQAAKQFSSGALQKIKGIIAPHIVVADQIKEAAALVLFAKERFHILFLGDPGIGKTEIIRSASELHPIHAFGLGSGSSGVGLTGTVRGKMIIPGLLPDAHNGICAIDELNLLPEKERGSLYNAMEKGFVTYNKGATKERFEAQVRILATANPKGDRFIGKDISFLKRQLPFDPALMTRFHLVFLMRIQNIQDFKRITKAIVSSNDQEISEEDKNFVTRYIEHVHETNVDFPQEYEEQIVSWVTEHKEKEDQYLVDISPRIVVGIVRVTQALARIHMRDEVIQEDVNKALELFEFSFSIPESIRRS